MFLFKVFLCRNTWNPTYDRVIFYYESAKEVETLPLKELYHHKNELSTPLVPLKSKEDSTNETLQVVGILGKNAYIEVQEMSYKWASTNAFMTPTKEYCSNSCDNIA